MEAKAIAGAGAHFVLVHGACHGAWCWYKLLPLLKMAGHDATAIDLSSCGIHSMGAHQIQAWSDLNQPLTHLINSLPPHEKVILVGHDMGGMNLSLIMEQFPEKIQAAVFLTAFMPLTGSSTMEMISEVQARIQSWGDTEFVVGMNGMPISYKFGHTFSRQMLYQNSPTEDVALGELLRRKFPIIQGEAVFSEERYGRVPRVYVVAKDDKLIWEELQKEMITENPPDRVYEMEGSDHSPFFCNPSRLAEILDEISSSYPKGRNEEREIISRLDGNGNAIIEIMNDFEKIIKILEELTEKLKDLEHLAEVIIGNKNEEKGTKDKGKQVQHSDEEQEQELLLGLANICPGELEAINKLLKKMQ